LEESGLATTHPQDASHGRSGDVVVPQGQKDASGGIPDEHVGDAVARAIAPIRHGTGRFRFQNFEVDHQPAAVRLQVRNVCLP
jgi:hypothetical protein